MKLRDIFLTASANMFRSKLRTTLTILAIFIGAFTLTLTNGIGAGVSRYIDKQVSNLGQKDVLVITAKSTNTGGDEPQKYEPGKVTNSGAVPGRASVLTKSDITALEANKDLRDVQATYAISPDYIEGANGQKFKIASSQVGGAAKLDLAAGNELETNATENQLVLPIGYVSSLGYGNAEQAVGKQASVAVTDAYGRQHILQATIVGVQQKGLIGSSGAAFNQTLITNAYNLQTTGLPDASKDKYLSATAYIAGDLTESHISDVKSRLSAMGYTGQTAQDLLGVFKSVVNAIIGVLDAFAVIALLAASLGIVNTLLMSVQERTKEIGLMKAMGMRSSRIFLLFSIEAVLIGFWGSIVGVGAAILVGRVANHIVSDGVLKDLPGFDLLAFPLQSIVTIMLLIMAIAFIAGTLPARRAAKQNPIDALRYE
jgi:putative ABC transport system permease protein